jgi:hypothetical protein
MVSRKDDLFKLFLAHFASWQGESDKTASIFETLIEQNKSLPFFYEDVTAFKEFINSRDCTHPFRYEKKPLPLMQSFFSNNYYVVSTAGFKKINAILEKAILETKPSKEFLLNAFIPILIATKTLIKSNFLFYISLLLPISVSAIPSKEEILEKINIDPAIKMSAEHAELKKEELAVFVMSEIEKDPLLSEKITSIWRSKNFQLIYKKELETPFAVGSYSGDKNRISLIKKDNYFCTDYNVIFKHEVHHAFMGITHTDSDPIHSCENKSIAECDDFNNPFSNQEERMQLEKALHKGKKRIINHLAELQEKWEKGKLNDKETLQYDSYVNVLSDYQPRCIAHVIPFHSHEYRQSIKLLQSGKPIPGSIYPIYPLHNEEIPGVGIAIFGNFNNVKTTQNNVKSYIQDTQYIYSNWINLYDQTGKNKNLIVKELDAEVHGDYPKVLNMFYPEVVKYHSLFQKKYIPMIEKDPKRTLIQNKPDL